LKYEFAYQQTITSEVLLSWKFDKEKSFPQPGEYVIYNNDPVGQNIVNLANEVIFLQSISPWR
jgi:hypothetical protein